MTTDCAATTHCTRTGTPASRRGPAPARVRAGFTIIELLLALILMAILASIAVPMLDRGRITVDTAIRETNMLLLGAQRLAIQRQHNVVVAFDTAAGVIRVHQDADNDGVIDAGETTHSMRLENGVRFGRGVAAARSIGGEAVTFSHVQDGMPAVTFARGGTASEIGGFYLTIPGGSAARVVEVERATGRTLGFQWENGSWHRWF